MGDFNQVHPNSSAYGYSSSVHVQAMSTEMYTDQAKYISVNSLLCEEIHS